MEKFDAAERYGISLVDRSVDSVERSIKLICDGDEGDASQGSDYEVPTKVFPSYHEPSPGGTRTYCVVSWLSSDFFD